MHRVAFAVLWKVFPSGSPLDQNRGTSQVCRFVLRSGTGTARWDSTPSHVSAMLRAPCSPAFTLTVATRRARGREAPSPSLCGCCTCSAACALLHVVCSQGVCSNPAFCSSVTTSNSCTLGKKKKKDGNFFLGHARAFPPSNTPESVHAILPQQC